MHTYLVLDHPIVIVVSVTSIGPQVVADQILGSPLTVGKTTGLEVVALQFVQLHIGVTMSQNLGLCTKILLLVLREVIHRSLVPVERAQILVIIGILVIIKRIHPLVTAINYLGLVWDLHATFV